MRTVTKEAMTQAAEPLEGELGHINRLARRELTAEEGMSGQVLRSIADELEGEELEALRACYEKRLEKTMALPTQLCYGGGQTGPAGDDGAFSI